MRSLSDIHSILPVSVPLLVPRSNLASKNLFCWATSILHLKGDFDHLQGDDKGRVITVIKVAAAYGIFSRELQAVVQALMTGASPSLVVSCDRSQASKFEYVSSDDIYGLTLEDSESIHPNTHHAFTSTSMQNSHEYFYQPLTYFQSTSASNRNLEAEMTWDSRLCTPTISTSQDIQISFVESGLVENSNLSPESNSPYTTALSPEFDFNLCGNCQLPSRQSPPLPQAPSTKLVSSADGYFMRVSGDENSMDEKECSNIMQMIDDSFLFRP